MVQIPDDPIIRSMEATGWPPWMLRDWEDDEEQEEDDGEEWNNSVHRGDSEDFLL